MSIVANDGRRAFTGAIRVATAQVVRALGELQRAAVDAVFPAVCVSCGSDMQEDAGKGSAAGAPICRDCFQQLALTSSVQACPRCAAPLPRLNGNGDLPDLLAIPKCVHCDGRRYWFRGALAAGRYTGLLRELVLRMKRSEENAVSLAMGKLIWQCCGDRLAGLDVDLVVPVPMHWRRRAMHGTNSAELLSEVIAGRLQRPMRRRTLRRRRNTLPQASLSTNRRKENVRGAFAVRTSRRLAGAHVLLVDDIMTSGATCNEAARVLRKAGARQVTVVVASRATS